MMKTAVLLTGQIRTIELTKKVIRDTFPEADFFLSVDRSNQLQCGDLNSKVDTETEAIERLMAYFRPKGHYVDYGQPEDYRDPSVLSRRIRVSKFRASRSELTYDDYHRGELYRKGTSFLPTLLHTLEDRLLTFVHPKLLRPFFDTYQVEVVHKILFEQYYYVQKAIDLLRKQERTSGEAYTTIVRLRFDQLLYNTQTLERMQGHLKFSPENIAFMDSADLGLALDFSTLADDEIVVFGYGHLHHYFYVNDQHFVMTAEGLRKMENFYGELHGLIVDSILSDTYPTHEGRIEYLFGLWLSRKKFRLRKAEEFGYGGKFIRALE